MQSGLAHFHLFSTKEPGMNLPNSPKDLIFAPIWRSNVFFDLGIRINILRNANKY
jgi:hypothetical protein